ncbi:hypothetical protein D3C85_1363440 [compost metagenome]
MQVLFAESADDQPLACRHDLIEVPIGILQCILHWQYLFGQGPAHSLLFTEAGVDYRHHGGHDDKHDQDGHPYLGHE